MLVGVDVADLADRGLPVRSRAGGHARGDFVRRRVAGFVPLGMLSDAVPTRMLMTSGALLAAVATGSSVSLNAVSVFVVSRAHEGLASGGWCSRAPRALDDATAEAPRLGLPRPLFAKRTGLRVDLRQCCPLFAKANDPSAT